MGAHPRDRAGALHPRGGITPKHTPMDGAEKHKTVITSATFQTSLLHIMNEGIECRHLATKSRMYRNIILDAHLIIYRIGKERIEVLDIVHAASSLRRIRDIRKIKI